MARHQCDRQFDTQHFGTRKITPQNEVMIISAMELSRASTRHARRVNIHPIPSFCNNNSRNSNYNYFNYNESSGTDSNNRNNIQNNNHINRNKDMAFNSTAKNAQRTRQNQFSGHYHKESTMSKLPSTVNQNGQIFSGTSRNTIKNVKADVKSGRDKAGGNTAAVPLKKKQRNNSPKKKNKLKRPTKSYYEIYQDKEGHAEGNFAKSHFQRSEKFRRRQKISPRTACDWQHNSVLGPFYAHQHSWQRRSQGQKNLQLKENYFGQSSNKYTDYFNYTSENFRNRQAPSSTGSSNNRLYYFEGYKPFSVKNRRNQIKRTKNDISRERHLPAEAEMLSSLSYTPNPYSEQRIAIPISDQPWIRSTPSIHTNPNDYRPTESNHQPNNFPNITHYPQSNLPVDVVVLNNGHHHRENHNFTPTHYHGWRGQRYEQRQTQYPKPFYDNPPAAGHRHHSRHRTDHIFGINHISRSYNDQLTYTAPTYATYPPSSAIPGLYDDVFQGYRDVNDIASRRQTYNHDLVTDASGLESGSSRSRNRGFKYHIVWRILMKLSQLICGLVLMGLILAPARGHPYRDWVMFTKSEGQIAVLIVCSIALLGTVAFLVTGSVANHSKEWQAADALYSGFGILIFLSVGVVEIWYSNCYPPLGTSVLPYYNVCYMTHWVLATMFAFVTMVLYGIDLSLAVTQGITLD